MNAASGACTDSATSAASAAARNSGGYRKFLRAKLEDEPDLGQGYYVNSHRHLWEVDFWKFLKCARAYREMLDED